MLGHALQNVDEVVVRVSPIKITPEQVFTGSLHTFCCSASISRLMACNRPGIPSCVLTGHGLSVN